MLDYNDLGRVYDLDTDQRLDNLNHTEVVYDPDHHLDHDPDPDPDPDHDTDHDTVDDSGRDESTADGCRF